MKAQPTSPSSGASFARLLTLKQAAHRLGTKNTSILHKLGIPIIRLRASGAGSAARVDAHVLEAFLDKISGIEPNQPATSEADAALADWERRYA